MPESLATTVSAGPPEAPPVASTETGEVLGRGASVGRYLVLEAIGSGGMGNVYAAYDPRLERKVALKVLAAGLGVGRGQERLLEEARAVARLAHPNVVAVHDAGSFGDRLFLAMELIEGESLDRWLRRRRPGWKETLRVLLQAGRGLAAAHGAGLVHGDFKPGNVMVGDDGRARVVDFGLARPRPGVSGEQDGDRTRPGGTPSFMAPEQHAGAAADALSDQYSFALSLYRALYGEHPFAGRSDAERLASARVGEVRAPPPGSEVPRPVRRVLLRALAPGPGARFPSTEELLTALERVAFPRKRGWWAAAFLAIAAVALAVWLLGRGGEAALCTGAEEEWAGLWDVAVKGRLEEAFLSTGVPFAPRAWAGFEGRLDAYRADWIDMHRSACEATRVQGTQSEALLDRRMLCLDRARREAGALATLLAKADPGAVGRALEAAEALPALASCADLRGLAARLPPPADPAERREVEELRQTLAEARARLETGRPGEGLERLETAVPAAEDVGYPPVAAEALYLRGRLLRETGQRRPAAESYERALAAAVRGGHEEVAVEALGELAWTEGYALADPAAGRRWIGLAKAHLAHAGSPPRLAARISRQEGILLAEAGDYQAAEAAFREALELAGRAPERRPVELARILGDLGGALHHQRRGAEAVGAIERAFDELRAHLGLHHPTVGIVEANLGATLLATGESRAAVERLESAFARLEASVGPRHPMLANVVLTLAMAARAQLRHRSAHARAEQALALAKTALAERPHPILAYSMLNAGVSRLYLGDPGGAGQIRRAEELLGALRGSEHPDLASFLLMVGTFHGEHGEPERALALLGRGRALIEDSHGAELPAFLRAEAVAERAAGRPREALALLERCRELAGEAAAASGAELELERGRTYLDLGREREGLELVEGALARLREAEVPSARLAWLRFRLAEALWAVGRREEALAVAGEVHRRLAEEGEAPLETAAVERWLVAREARGART